MRRRLRQILQRYHGPGVSPATRSRYRIPFIWDITTLLKVGEILGLADLFYGGMLHRPAHSIEVVLLYALVGDDYLCLPLDFHLRQPDPQGPGHPCLDGMALAQKMMEDLHHALRVHFLKVDGHYLVADAWFADGRELKRARQIGLIPIVRGKTSFVFDGQLLGQPFPGSFAPMADDPGSKPASKGARPPCAWNSSALIFVPSTQDFRDADDIALMIENHDFMVLTYDR